MSSPKHERGVALIVSLIMLVVFTLFVVSSINTSNVNLKVVGNDQAKKTVDASVQQGVEVMVTQTAFDSPPTTANTININAGTKNSETVTIGVPQCQGSQQMPGYSLVTGALPGSTGVGGAGGPQLTYWDLQGTVTDPATGATTEVHQGIKVVLPASCS